MLESKDLENDNDNFVLAMKAFEKLKAHQVHEFLNYCLSRLMSPK